VAQDLTSPLTTSRILVIAFQNADYAAAGRFRVRRKTRRCRNLTRPWDHSTGSITGCDKKRDGSMGEKLVVGFIVTIVFGQPILAAVFPTTARVISIRSIFGLSQLIMGVVFYILLLSAGSVWPWAFMVSLIGIYNLWIAWGLYRAQQGSRPM
jgi:hypothetical protein